MKTGFVLEHINGITSNERTVMKGNEVSHITCLQQALLHIEILMYIITHIAMIR